MKNLLKINLNTYSYLSFLKFVEVNNLKIFNINQINEYKYEFECSYLSYLKIKKNNKNCKIIKSNSQKILLLKFFSEKLVVICVIISSLFYIFLSKLIIEVKIEGTSAYLNNYIKQELKSINIEKYEFSPSISQLKEIEKNIYLQNIDKFDIFNITKKGSYIFVNYQVKKKNIILDEVKGKIYSKKDAIISKILISTGNVLIKENDFVNKGQLLVDDQILINSEPYFVGTKGLIYGYTYNKVEINYVNIEDSLIEARYLISKDYVLDEKILEEKIIFNDEDNKKMVLHYKCEEILNSF